MHYDSADIFKLFSSFSIDIISLVKKNENNRHSIGYTRFYLIRGKESIKRNEKSNIEHFEIIFKKVIKLNYIDSDKIALTGVK